MILDKVTDSGLRPRYLALSPSTSECGPVEPTFFKDRDALDRFLLKHTGAIDRLQIFEVNQLTPKVELIDPSF